MNAGQSPPRQPHAVLDLASRQHKARKIERLLGLRPRVPLRLLDIGTGSGGIAHYFATHPDLNCIVTGVDVVDQRQVREGYAFQLIEDSLPFPDGSFDVVLSNHVIEHVGARPGQLAHLREVRRVLASDGVGYLAVPNRWALIEPHYRLAFLSWLPRALRTPYLRLMRRGHHYDCEPLSLAELDALLAESGYTVEHLEIAAFRIMFELERPGAYSARLVARLPTGLLTALLPLFPTLVCRLNHRQGGMSG